MRRPLILLLALLSVGVAIFLTGCAGDRRHVLVISTRDQQMVVYDQGIPVAEYPVSTSKFGLGDRPGSNQTPVGNLRIRK
jgi:hypothetical protein